MDTSNHKSMAFRLCPYAKLKVKTKIEQYCKKKLKEHYQEVMGLTYAKFFGIIGPKELYLKCDGKVINVMLQ